MWTCEVLPPRIDILHYLIPMWHGSQTSSIFAQMPFVSLLWILFVMDVLGTAFPKYVRIYLFGKPIASSYSLKLLCIIAWILKLSRISIYLSMAFNSYPLPYAYFLWSCVYGKTWYALCVTYIEWLCWCFGSALY